MNVRPLAAEDVAVVAAWMVTIPLWQRYGVTVERISAQLTAALYGDDLLLVADGAEQACGFAWCMHKGAFGRSAYLRLLGVRPVQARMGMGAALLNAVEQAVTSADLFLLVSDFNTEAQRFYRRQGYTMIGSIPGYVLPDVTELIFRKVLR